MNITLFGASGKTGQVVIDSALNSGHKVRTYARRKDAIARQHDNLEIIIGNLDDKDKISEAIAGADACISTLGGSSLKKRAVEVTDGIDLIVSLMEKQNVSRLIYLSSLGAGESRYYMPRLTRFIVADLLLRIPIADHNLNEKRIEKSKLQWTILRPGGLSDENYTGKYLFGSDKIVIRGNPKISRSNVAAFIIDQLSDTSLLHKAVWMHE